MTSALVGTSIRCTCCPRRKKVGELDFSGIEIISGHSQDKHSATVTPEEILYALSGTEGTGVIQYVRRILSLD